MDHERRERNEPNMHPRCTQAAPPGSTTAMDRGHGEAYAVIVVGQWTGQEASALRQALRLTIRDFADHLGVAERTVAKWEAGGSAMVPMPVMQAALDTVLARASDDAKGRFGMLLAPTRDPAGVPGSPVALGAAALASPAPVPRRVDPEAVGRLGTILTEYAKIDNLLGPAHLLALTALHLKFISELLTVASGEGRRSCSRSGPATPSSPAGCTRTPATRRRRLLVRPGDGLGPGRRQRPHGLLRAHAQEQPSIQLERCAPNPWTGSGGPARAGSALASRSCAGASPRGARPRAVRRSNRMRPGARRCSKRGRSPGGPGEEDRILTGYCTPAFIEMEAADCAMLLGQPDQAVVTFQHGLAILPGQYQRDRAVNLARLAVAYAASQEPELACAVAQEAAAIVASTWSARAVAELRRLPTLLSGWPDSAAVAELEATLAALP